MYHTYSACTHSFSCCSQRLGEKIVPVLCPGWDLLSEVNRLWHPVGLEIKIWAKSTNGLTVWKSDIHLYQFSQLVLPSGCPHGNGSQFYMTGGHAKVRRIAWFSHLSYRTLWQVVKGNDLLRDPKLYDFVTCTCARPIYVGLYVS